ncbi:NAD-dependent deacylase [candidate division KSB1 bacterium]|nr:NAD-dependent deacylase [candidate division KSB1 bacterium]
MNKTDLLKAAELIIDARHAIVFTGAGISVESGIPPFRGQNGLWAKYDPTYIELQYFFDHPYQSWKLIKQIFYDFMGKAKPNAAHIAVAELEQKGFVKSVITQNIDNLHQEAGSKTVLEFHGTTRRFQCVECRRKYDYDIISLETLPPACPNCEGLIKPDFVFFSEMIPTDVNNLSFAEAQNSDIIIVIGTTGEIMPACYIPYQGKQTGSKIIEVNIDKSAYTNTITDIFLQGKATEIMSELKGLVADG